MRYKFKLVIMLPREVPHISNENLQRHKHIAVSENHNFSLFLFLNTPKELIITLFIFTALLKCVPVCPMCCSDVEDLGLSEDVGVYERQSRCTGRNNSARSSEGQGLEG